MYIHIYIHVYNKKIKLCTHEFAFNKYDMYMYVCVCILSKIDQFYLK